MIHFRFIIITKILDSKILIKIYLSNQFDLILLLCIKNYKLKLKNLITIKEAIVIILVVLYLNLIFKLNNSNLNFNFNIFSFLYIAFFQITIRYILLSNSKYMFSLYLIKLMVFNYLFILYSMIIHFIFFYYFIIIMFTIKVSLIFYLKNNIDPLKFIICHQYVIYFYGALYYNYIKISHLIISLSN